MNKRILLFLCPVFIASGCISHLAPPSSAVNVSINPAAEERNVEACLSERSEIPSAVTEYRSAYDLSSEDDKIEYLISRFRRSQAIFIRNETEYGGRAAAKFYRWKMDRLRSRDGILIHTAQEFIDKIATASRVSGEYYLVRFPTGEEVRLRDVLTNELQELESCLSATI